MAEEAAAPAPAKDVDAVPDPMGPGADEITGISDAIAAKDEIAERRASVAALAHDTSTLSPQQRAVFEAAYAAVCFGEDADPTEGVTRDQIADWVAEQYSIDVDADTSEGGLKSIVDGLFEGDKERIGKDEFVELACEVVERVM